MKLEDIDAISGATITSEAIVEAINEAQKQVGPAEEASAEKAPAEEKKAVEETLPEGAVTVSKDGFAGPVAVTVQFGSDNATIESVKIGDDQFGETEGFGAEALKPEFGQQFIGKKAPLKLEDIDAISGATITSEAVVDAINEAQKQISNKNTSKSVEAAPATERTASAKGFSGDVTVKVGFNQDGVITSFEIEKNAFGDVEGFGKAVLDETFTKQMIGKKAPLSIEDVDAVSFATQTVKAVVEAVNVAYAQK